MTGALLCLKKKKGGISLSLKSPVVVVGRSLHQVHFGPRYAAYGPVPVVSYTHVEVSGVKILKILVEGHKVLHMDKHREREGESTEGLSEWQEFHFILPSTTCHSYSWKA